MEQNTKQLNQDFIIQSLQIQLSNAHMQIAERDALITAHHQRIQELEKELEELRRE